MRIIDKAIMALTGLCSTVGVASANGPPYLTPQVTPTITLLPTTTYGNAWQNLTQSNFSLTYFPSTIMQPFTWTTNGVMIIPFFLLFFGLYAGMWISHQNVKVAAIVGLLFGATLTGSSFIVVLPGAAVAIAYAALAASLAGMVMAIMK